MITHIHTHEVDIYGICIVATLSLGCSNIASHIHNRWFAVSKLNPMKIHWFVKLAIVLYSVMFCSISEYVLYYDRYMVFYILLAVLIGYSCIQIELLLLRYFYRACYTDKTLQYYTYQNIHYGYASGIAANVKSTKVSIQNIHSHHAALNSEIKKYALFDVLVIAVLEEIIFRGFLLKLCSSLSPQYLVDASLFVTVILFAGCHVIYGKGQFFSKLILGSACLFIVICSKSIFPAIIVHGIFNYFAYQHYSLVKGARVGAAYVF